MQAWNSVKVINVESLHHGRAGRVIRIEKSGELQFVQVALDDAGEGKPAETEPFSAAELQLL